MFKTREQIKGPAGIQTHVSKCVWCLGWVMLLIRERKPTQISELDVGGGEIHFQNSLISFILDHCKAIRMVIVVLYLKM